MIPSIPNSIIRDNIEGNRLIEAPKKIRQIIDCPEFQRLRAIKQTGFTSYVFPTAEHSRFAHSLGVYATAIQFFRHLKLRSGNLSLSPLVDFDEKTESDFMVAALCHDIGHTPFSHVLEAMLLPKGIGRHEDCTVALLDETRTIGKAIKVAADLDAVKLFIANKHPNKALNDLISSEFDVDRCDYLIRDAHMAGVEYGRFDLKWLLHAVTVEVNELGQPVLLMDGPRGIDAFRQFLSARRYMYRQVYYHPTIRGASILLKAIFRRMQDYKDHSESLQLIPTCLQSAISGNISIDDFLRTTDIEVNFMIRNFADSHRDPVLSHLAQLFVTRQFPKAVLDSAKVNESLTYRYKFGDDVESENAIATEASPFLEELRAFVADRLQRIAQPPEVANYLVAIDRAPFKSPLPTDILFAFGGETVSLQEIDSGCVGFDVEKLSEPFAITRLFVPRGVSDAAREYIQARFRVKSSTDSESTQ
jgi:HD superfamily phosphohydrolase